MREQSLVTSRWSFAELWRGDVTAPLNQQMIEWGTLGRDDEPKPPEPPQQTPNSPVKEPPDAPQDEPHAPVREPDSGEPKKWGGSSLQI